jgi:hypothetical protein
VANIDDLVTVQKNGVVAINDLTASLNAFRALYESFVGNRTAVGITDDSLIYTGAGRLVNVAVTAGTAGGTVHDAASVADATSANTIFVLPTTTGLTQINMPFLDGLVINPGASVTVAVTYSES